MALCGRIPGTLIRLSLMLMFGDMSPTPNMKYPHSGMDSIVKAYFWEDVFLFLLIIRKVPDLCRVN